MNLSMESTFLSRVRLLSTGFRYADTRMFVGRADLYLDRIELRGFGSRHSGRRAIRLDAIRHVHFGDEDGRHHPTTFHLDDDERLELFFRKRYLWKRRVLNRLEWNRRLFTVARPSKDPADCVLSFGI